MRWAKVSPLGAVTALVDHMAGGLVREQVHGFVAFHGESQQIDHVAGKGDGGGCLPLAMLPGQGEGLRGGLGHGADPPLVQAGLDAAWVHLGDDGHAARDLHGLSLGAAHAAQAGRYKEPSGQVPVLGDAELDPAGVEQGAVGAVDNPLGADVHPPAGGHLSVVGHPQGHGPVPVRLIVEHAHHEGVGDQDPGGSR